MTTPAETAQISAYTALAAVIIAPFVHLIIGWRQTNAAKTSADAAISTAKNTGTREIARMRLQWLHDLRETISDYHAHLMMDRERNPEDRRKLSQLGTKLDLMINMNEPIQKKLWDIADAIYHENDLERRRAQDKPLMEAGRAVVKQEWERIKQELRGT